MTRRESDCVKKFSLTVDQHKPQTQSMILSHLQTLAWKYPTKRVSGKNNAVYDVTGESDIIVIARFRTRDELSAFTKELLSTPFVERTNTKLVLTTIKEDFWHLVE